jgi:hypothetical protein
MHGGQLAGLASHAITEVLGDNDVGAMVGVLSELHIYVAGTQHNFTVFLMVFFRKKGPNLKFPKAA